MATQSDLMQKPSSGFVEYLHNLLKEENRRALAVLRRAITNEGIDFSAYTIIGSRLPNLKPSDNYNSYLLTACLFAHHQIPANNGRSLGYSAQLLERKLREKRKDLTQRNESLDHRFSNILNAHNEDLGIYLRHFFSLLKANEIPVDYTKLLQDLRVWHYDSKQAQMKWARDYWVNQKSEDESGEKTTSDAS